MIKIEDIKKVYFLGIGGIGMSAIARYFKHIGRFVAGYDRNKTGITDRLILEGIPVHFQDNISEIPENLNVSDTLVIYTPAIPENNKEYNWLKNQGFQIIKRAMVLGDICNTRKCIAVAGTHGKTTISTILSVILKESKVGCGAFLGGISKNYESNFLASNDKNDWIVTEADEYDRSFLNLTPGLALISSIDADHLDIYGEYENIKQSFNEFAGNIKKGGKLVLKEDIDIKINPKKNIETFTYSLFGKADFYISGLEAINTCYEFTLHSPFGEIPGIRFNYPGLINVENAIGASALALLAGVPFGGLKTGLEKYSGVKRRFDILYKGKGRIYIDDYAHHPEELKAVINSVRMLYPDKKIAAIFQPHLYSRTKDLATGFARSLDMSDEIILLPVYPARELPIKGVSSGIILSEMKNKKCRLLEKYEVPEWLKRNDVEILMTLGAGDIDTMSDSVIQILKSKENVG